MSTRTATAIIRAQVEDSALNQLAANADKAATSLEGTGRAADKAREATAKIGGDADQSVGRLDRMTSAFDRNRESMDRAGTAFTVFGTAGTAALAASAAAAISWESDFAGVMKTVDDSPEGYARLNEELREMARTLPASHSEIAGVAEAAGQLGVAREDITSFTGVMSDLGETTNLTSDEAATAIAQMSNVMQTAPEDVERLASTLVELGNNGASTERDIINMSQRIAGAGAVVGLTERDVLALSNTTASMGINAEAGGTAISRVFTDMSSAVQTNSAELEVFAETAGMTAEEFAAAFETDPVRAFDAFIQGLGGIREEGGNVFGVLDELALSDVRVSQALLGMASSGDLLTESLDMADEAWVSNTALMEEAATRYETNASKIQVMKNNIADTAIEVGERFIPYVESAVDFVTDLVGGIGDLPDSVLDLGAGLGVMATGASLLAGAGLLLVPRMADTAKAIRDIYRWSGTTNSRLGGLTRTLGRAGIAGVALATVAGLASIGREMSDVELTSEDLTTALIKLREESEGSTEGIETLFRGFTTSTQVSEGDLTIERFQEGIRNLNDQNFLEAATTKVDRFGSSLVGGLFGKDIRSEFTVLTDSIEDLDGHLGLLAADALPQAQQQFSTAATVMGYNKDNYDELLRVMPEYREALERQAAAQGMVAETGQPLIDAANAIAAELEAGPEVMSAWVDEEELLRQGMELLEPTLSGVTTTVEGYAVKARLAGDDTATWQDRLDALNPALGLSGEEAEEAAKKHDEFLGVFRDSYSSFVDHNAAIEASNTATQDWAQAQADATESTEDTWEDFVDGVGFNLEAYTEELEKQAEAQRAWSENLVALTGEIPEAYRQELAAMGPAAAPLVQSIIAAEEPERKRLVEAWEATGGDAAGGYASNFASILEASPDLIAAASQQLSGKAMDAFYDDLASGEYDAQGIVAKWDLDLNASVDLTKAEYELSQQPAPGWSVMLEPKYDNMLEFVNDPDSKLPRPVVKVEGDTEPLLQDYEAGVGAVLARPPATPQIHGDADPYDATAETARRETDASFATSEIRGDADPFDLTLDGALRTTNNSHGTAEIRGDDDPAMGSLSTVLRAIDTASATLDMYADTSGAQGDFDRWVRNNDGTTISVVAKVTGQIASAVAAIAGNRDGGAYTAAYANGGPAFGVDSHGRKVRRESMLYGRETGVTDVLWDRIDQPGLALSGEANDIPWEIYISPRDPRRGRFFTAMAARRFGGTAIFPGDTTGGPGRPPGAGLAAYRDGGFATGNPNLDTEIDLLTQIEIEEALQSAMTGVVNDSLETIFGGLGALSGGTNTGAGPSGGWRGIWALVQRLIPGAIMTSNYRPGARTATGFQSRHALGLAVDFVSANMRSAAALLAALGTGWRELYFSGWGFMRNGRMVPRWLMNPRTIEDHWDHVHVAMADGGEVGLTTGRRGVDSELRWLQPEEHVLTKADVIAMGGHDAVYRWRSALNAGMSSAIPQFDVGGAVEHPRQVRVAAAQRFVAAPGAQGASSGGADLRAVAAAAGAAAARETVAALRAEPLQTGPVVLGEREAVGLGRMERQALRYNPSGGM